MKPLNEQELEKLLRSPPKFERSREAEAKFFKKLEALVQQKKIGGTLEKVAPFGRINFLASLRLGLAGSFAALILIVGGTFAAYQPSVTRGTFLYPWKQAAERVELGFAFTSLQKVDTHVRFSDRRLEEAQNIVTKNPSLAWLFPKVSAHEGEIHLDTEAAMHFAETLSDMRREMTLAAEIVETKISAPEEAERALTKIEIATDRHVEVLTRIEKEVPKELEGVVKKFVEDEDEHLALVVEAKEEVKAAASRKEKTFTVKFEKREEKKGERQTEAKEELKAAIQIFEKLPVEEKEHLKDQLERAKEALEEGKFGRTKGLSRALLNELKEQSKVKPNGVPAPKFPDPGFKPEAKKNNAKKEKLPKKEERNEPKSFDDKPLKIYNDPLLSPPNPEEYKEEEHVKIEPFLMELEDVKDGEGLFKKEKTRSLERREHP